MMDIFLALLLLFIAAIFCYYNVSFGKPPGPVSYPFVGNSFLIKSLCKQFGGLHLAAQQLCKQYNTNVISLTLGSEYTVIVQSDELVQEVASRDEFLGRPDNFFTRLRCMGKRIGITMTDGPYWAEQRAFAVKLLHELGLGKRRADEMIQQQLQEFTMTLEKLEISNLTLRKRFSTCILNVLWEMITGESFKRNEQTLNDLISLMEKRAKAFDMAGGIINQFPFIHYIFPNYSGYRLITSLNKTFKNMILATINEHKETYSKDVTRDYIDAFLHEIYKRNSPDSSFTEDQLVMVCLDFFIAGSQTSSTSLDFLVLHMLVNPEVQEKVQHELANILQPGQVPSYGDRLKCPYVEAVILESQRLAAVNPFFGPRRVICDTTLDGYFIPKGTCVLMNIASSLWDPNKWEDSKAFKPERFLKEDGKLITDHQLTIFGKGKRKCPGEALAKNFLFIFFAGLMNNYKFSIDKQNPPSLKIVPGITLSPAEYSFKMTRRF